jgi:hypothetical protein
LGVAKKALLQSEDVVDADISKEGDLYILFRLTDRMTIYRINNQGDVSTLIRGVKDYISMISVIDSELWAFGRDSHKFYKFIL